MFAYSLRAYPQNYEHSGLARRTPVVAASGCASFDRAGLDGIATGRTVIVIIADCGDAGERPEEYTCGICGFVMNEAPEYPRCVEAAHHPTGLWMVPRAS